MTDLEVATTELQALGTRIKGLSSDLEKVDAKAGYDVTELAHRTVIDAMDEFKDNWDDNRKHVADRLSKLGDLASETASSFTEADEELATKVREIMEGEG